MTQAQCGDLEGLGAPSLCIAALRMSDIDYSAIIEGHVQWKLRLRKYLEGLPVDFDVHRAQDFQNCALGKWLQENPDAPKSLVTAHREFHELAGRVVSVSEKQGVAEAKALLGRDEFARATASVVNQLMAMRLGASAEAAPKKPAQEDGSVDAAIVSLLEWRTRFRDWLSGRPGDFDPRTVATTTACRLGKWLVVQPPSPLRAKGEEAHAAFHRLAGRAIELKAQSAPQALALLDSPEFNVATANVVNAIAAMRTRAA